MTARDEEPPPPDVKTPAGGEAGGRGVLRDGHTGERTGHKRNTDRTGRRRFLLTALSLGLLTPDRAARALAAEIRADETLE